MMKKILIVCLVISLLFLCGCVEKGGEATILQEGGEVDLGEDINRPRDVQTVIVDNFQFNPIELEVMVGETVEWVNSDGVDHTVTFENGDVDERLVDSGRVSYTFEEAGEYPYFCSLHPGMRGSIIVR